MRAPVLSVVVLDDGNYLDVNVAQLIAVDRCVAMFLHLTAGAYEMEVLPQERQGMNGIVGDADSVQLQASALSSCAGDLSEELRDVVLHPCLQLLIRQSVDNAELYLLLSP